MHIEVMTITHKMRLQSDNKYVAGWNKQSKIDVYGPINETEK